MTRVVTRCGARKFVLSRSVLDGAQVVEGDVNDPAPCAISSAQFATPRAAPQEKLESHRGVIGRSAVIALV